MTFFLDDFDAEKIPPPRGPDIQPQGFIPSWMAATSQIGRDANVLWQRQREVNRETLKTTEPAARKLGIEELNRRYEAEYGGYDHRNPPPQSVDDFYAMHPDNVTNELVLKAAREAASADPAGWSDLDLTDDGIQARVTEMRKAEDQDEAEINSMSNYPVMSQLAGGLTASLIDIRQAPLLFLGAGGGSLLRVLGQEAIMGAAGTAITLPSQYETAKELDKADPNPIEQITLGALGGAVIGGALHGLGRGIEYFRGRMAVPEIPGADPVYTHAAVDAAETALVNGDNPLAAVQRIMDSAPPPDLKPLPPLIPEQIDPPVSSGNLASNVPTIEQSVLPPAAGEPPRSAAEVGAVASRALDDVEGLNAVLADAKAADNARSKPLIGWLSKGHRVTKKDAAAGRTAGESLQIDPASTLGQELKAQDITPRTAPGLFKKGGRTNLDNLVASEMEDQFPGIMDATRTPQGADYLDQQGLLDLIVRDANGDASWLRSRADVQRVEADLELAMRAANGEDMGPASDYLAMKPDDGGFFVDLNAYQFDNPDWQGAIARDLEAFIAEKWPGVTFTAKERADILNHLTTNGGEAQNLVERLLERELDYGELPPSKVYSHADLEDPAYQRFLDEATASRVSDTGGEDPLGPVENGGAARGGPAGEVGADGQVSIPGTDRVDTGQAQRDAATIAARQQQSKMGRLDQTRVEDDAGGLFGGGQSDLFSDPLSKDARILQDSIAADFRDQVAREDFKVDLNDGKGERSASSLLDELDGDDEFAAILDACGKGKA